MTQELGFALLAFSSILAMVDPLGAIPVYLAMTGSYDRARRADTLRRAIVIGASILVGFGLLGTWIFSMFGITAYAFRITGGIILFDVGLDMLQARRSRVKTTEEEEAEGAHMDDVAIVPLGTPLIAGPGAITTVVALLAQTPAPVAQITVYLAILAVMLLTWIVLAVAPAVARVLGTTGMHVIERIMGLIVMVIGIQFVIDGAQEAILEFLPRLREVWG